MFLHALHFSFSYLFFTIVIIIFSSVCVCLHIYLFPIVCVGLHPFYVSQAFIRVIFEVLILRMCACVCLLVDFYVFLISCMLPILSASLVHGHRSFIQEVSVSPCVMYHIICLFFCVSLSVAFHLALLLSVDFVMPYLVGVCVYSIC